MAGGFTPSLPRKQFFSATGVPLVNGTVAAYVAGSVTPTDTWQDVDLTVLNTNPIVLDSRGECILYCDPNVSYEFVLKDALGVTQWTDDDISSSPVITLLGQVSLFAYMSTAQRADVLAGTLTLDVTTAIKNAIAANPSRMLLAPAGSYRVSSNIDLTAIGTWIAGEGGATKFYQYTANTDTFRLRPTTAGTTAAYGSLCGLRDLQIIHTPSIASSTSGAAVRVTQMASWSLLNVRHFDAAEGVTVEGGQLGTINGMQGFATGGTAQGAESALLHFKQAAYGAGLFQSMFTTEVSNLVLSAANLRDTCIRVADCDGLSINMGYANNNGGSSLLKVTGDRSASYVATLSVDNFYFDGVGGTCQFGVSIPNNGFTNPIYHVELGSGVKIGGCVYGVVGRKAELQTYRDSALIINCTTNGRDIEGGANTVVDIKGSSNNNGVTDIRLKGASSISLDLNGWDSTGAGTTALVLEGTWGRGVINGCVNNSNVADISNTATFTNGLKATGNQSAWTGLASQGWNSGVATKVASFTLGDLEDYVVCNGTGTITVTLPSAANYRGRNPITIKTIAAFTVVSASSNVAPIASATAGTAILAGTAGKWATLKSDGTSWIVIAAG